MNISQTGTPQPDDLRRETPAPRPVVGPQKPKRSPAVPAILGVVALLGVGLFLRSRSGGGAEREGAPRGPQIRTVKVVPVTTGTIVERLAITGQLRSNQDVNLGSKISGVVERVFVDEGDRVRRGQVLVQIDDDDLQQQVQTAQANLRAAQVRLGQTNANLPSRVAQLSSAVDQARAQLGNAQAAAQASQARFRQAQLNEPAQITTTRSQLEGARAGVSVAQSQVAQARNTARQIEGQVRGGIASARAALAQAEAQRQQVVAGSREQEKARAQAELNRTEALVEDAQTNLNRQNILYEGGATARANVDSAQTQLALAEANREAAIQSLSLTGSSRPEEVRQATEIVSQRRAALAQAESDINRSLAAQGQVTQALAGLRQSQESLRQSQAAQAGIPVTQQETRAAQEALNQARAQVRLQEASLRQARTNLSQAAGFRADVPVAQAAVDQARSQVEQAQLQVAQSRIISPVNGVVNTKFTDVGQTASPGVTLMNLVALDSVYFEAQVPESQLARIKIGQPARVTVTAISGQPIVGYISEIIPVADERLRQFRVRVTLPQREGLTPGAFARGSLQTNVVSNTLTVPSEVVRNEGEQTYVLVAVPGEENAQVKRRSVRVGASANGQTQIIGGIQSGDRIITGNVQFKDGDKVQLEGAGRSGGEGGSRGGGSEGSSGAGATGGSGSGGSGSGGSGSGGSGSGT